MKPEDIQFATNPEPRCPCIILADKSGSMTGSPITELNAGLKELKRYLAADELASLRVELALMSFNRSTTLEVDFTTPDRFEPPALISGGGTALGGAILSALDLLKERTAAFHAAGVPFYRPWLLLLSDAEASDDVTEAARRVKEAETQRRLSFFGIGVQGANMEKLAQISLRPPLHLDGVRFGDLFEWLSCNLSSVAASRPGDQVPLTPPDWSAA